MAAYSGPVRIILGALVATLAVAGPALAAGAKPISYLALHAGECATRSASTPKTVEVVPCSNPKHNLEVYAVEHGGWGPGTPPPAPQVAARAQFLCLNAFVIVTGHQLPSGYGWRGFWPDAGSEQKRYGDEVICSLGRYPSLAALGSGRHL